MVEGSNPSGPINRFLLIFMRIQLSCSELGLGHAFRTLSLGKELEKRGHELSFLAGGQPYKLFRKEFENVYECTPISWYENMYGILRSASLLNLLFPLPLFDPQDRRLKMKKPNAIEIMQRYYDLRSYVTKTRPDAIISDGDVMALRLAQRWGIPAVYIHNLIRPTFRFPQFLNPGERITESYVKKCPTKIIVPDFPPPYTICEYNLGDPKILGIEDKIEYTGAFIDMSPVEGDPDFIFAPITGPLGTRQKIARECLPILYELEQKSKVSLGEPENRRNYEKGSCEVSGWLSKEIRDEYMRRAKFVIFTGSHGTCMETIKYGKPSIIIPTQPEQHGNAKKMEEMKCSIYIKSGKELRPAIEKMQDKNNYNYYKRNVEKISQNASKFNGLTRAVEIIEEIN